MSSCSYGFRGISASLEGGKDTGNRVGKEGSNAGSIEMRCPKSYEIKADLVGVENQKQ